MIAEYVGILVLLAVALLLTGGLLVAHWGVGPRRELPAKRQPHEGGHPPRESPRRRFAVKFYVVAILFLAFQAGAIFFYPWGATFREVGWPGFVAMAAFSVPLVVGLVYGWCKGALEW